MKVPRISRLFLPLLFLLALPASAQASWTAPIDLSTPGFNASTLDPQVAVDATGRAFFVWVIDDNSPGSCCEIVQLRIRQADGTLGLVQNLTPSGENNSFPQVAVNANGDAAFVWIHNGVGYGLRGRTLSSSGTLGPIQLIAAQPYAFANHGVVIDPNANATFFWRSQDANTSTQCSGNPCWRIRTRSLSSGGTLGTTRTLSAVSQNGQNPDAGVDSNGNVYFVWLQGAGGSGLPGYSCNCNVAERVLSASGTLGALQQLSNPGALRPKVAVDPQGDATFTWEIPDANSIHRINTKTRSRTGSLSAVQTLSDAGQDAYLPQVAVDPSGNAVFTWERYDDTFDCPSNGNPTGYACLRVQTRSRSAAGSLNSVQTISAAKSQSEYPQVGIDQNDRAVFVWWSRTLKAIRARTRSATGVLGATQGISDPSEPTSSPNLDENNSQSSTYPPLALAVNPAGNAAADWFSFDGLNDRIDGTAGP